MNIVYHYIYFLSSIPSYFKINLKFIPTSFNLFNPNISMFTTFESRVKSVLLVLFRKRHLSISYFSFFKVTWQFGPIRAHNYVFKSKKLYFYEKIPISWGATWNKMRFFVKIRGPIRKRHIPWESWVNFLQVKANQNSFCSNYSVFMTLLSWKTLKKR